MLVYLEDNQKKKYLIENENFKIGRDGSQCQLKLPENLLFSALQATIVVQEDVPTIERYILVDQSSNKNTYINGKVIDKKILKHGDRIAFARDQDLSFTFKINISEPTLVPDENTFIKPKLEEKKQDLQSTIKESNVENISDGPKILDKEIEDLRNLMQNNMMKSTSDSRLSETTEEIRVTSSYTDSDTQMEVIAQEIEPIVKKLPSPVEMVSEKVIGEETEIDEKTPEKMEALRKAYEKITQEKVKVVDNTPHLISILDGKKYLLDQNIITVGSAKNSTIHFPKDPHVSPIHFKLVTSSNGIVVNPLDNNNVMLNGKFLQQSQKLKNLDILRAGKQILYFFASENENKDFFKNLNQTRTIVKNFQVLQNCGNQVELSPFHIQIQAKFFDKENVIYLSQKNNEACFILLGDLIGVNVGFGLIAQELQGALSSAVSLTSDLSTILNCLNSTLKKYNNHTCENNIPIVAKALLFKFTPHHAEWFNIGGHLAPLIVSKESTQKVQQPIHSISTHLMGYLDENANLKPDTISFGEDSIMLIQPDSLPHAKSPNYSKLLLKMKDIHHLINHIAVDNKFTSNFLKHIFASNVTSLISIVRKSSELKCSLCQKSFPENFSFCPYDSTKLV